MSVLDVAVVLVAGLVAGGINAIVGSGSLVTFPVLLAVGFPAVTANVSNTVGLVFGNVSAVWGYRRELRDQGRRVLLLGAGTGTGAATGALLLLVLPDGVFDAIVPLLILLACFLMARRPAPEQTTAILTPQRLALLGGTAYGVGVYGGYFGAAQGVILLAVLRLLLPDALQRLNGLKNALVGIANGVAAIGFVLFAHVAWDAAGLVAAGSIVGAALGARYGRRLPDRVLRGVVVVGGTLVAVVLAVRLVV
ncbi:sulfite exporter TauE/SafE family protein [Patulibacter sp. NPDC049589]|uniref:sulfite exporter TauE/SafE family protein n=1 Tax=Patulibacter sp. NPDC049589 TaxID=3154731 RepID=UPI00341BA7A5